METLLQGHVIVAGGAIGLGAAVTSRLTEVGASVTVIDQERSPDGLPTEIVDLADGLATEAAVLRLVEAGGDPSAVVTCADVDIPGRLDEIAGDEWENVVAVNLIGTAAVIRAALPSLRRAQGRIVTVASTLGHRGMAEATAYCASKFGVVGFTRALAAELAGEVGVTMLTPGAIPSAFVNGDIDQQIPPERKETSDPVDLAEAVVFALTAPPATEVREVVITPPHDPSWP